VPTRAGGCLAEEAQASTKRGYDPIDESCEENWIIGRADVQALRVDQKRFNVAHPGLEHSGNIGL
jgi:hypothetical protein